MGEARDPSFRGLDALVGEWDTEAVHQAFPSTVVRGRSVFEWLEGEKFLIVRARNDHPDFPDSVSVIGDTGGLRMHYFDSRGVARVYRTSFSAGVWKMWRDTPDLSPLDFAQRFAGTLSDDGTTVEGDFEICHDGSTWEHDMKITYRRSGSPGV